VEFPSPTENKMGKLSSRRRDICPAFSSRVNCIFIFNFFANIIKFHYLAAAITKYISDEQKSQLKKAFQATFAYFHRKRGAVAATVKMEPDAKE
jgi:hypothetical protein